MSAEPESFLTRWSRRKRAAEREAEGSAERTATQVPAAVPVKPVVEEEAAGGPVSTPASVSDPAATEVVPLPPIESLDGLRSEYQAFFQQPVDENLRRAALKKLFADPHFNQMDMLDVYVDDYTQFEPLPAAMRMRLPSARDFLLDSERAALEAADAGDAPDASIASVGIEGDAVSNSVADGEGFDHADDATVDSTCEPAAAPSSAAADAAFAAEPAKQADVSSTPAIPLRKATAPDSSST